MTFRSATLMRELRELHRLCETWGLSLRAEHLPSAVNVFADRLSRETDSTDWTLGPLAYAELESRFGPHTVDLFASHLNTNCRRFYSRHWSPGCSGTDAVLQPWTGDNLYSNPPFNLMPAVLEKAIREGTRVTLVAPRWEAQPWFWRGAEAAATVYHLPPEQGVFTHGARDSPAPKPPWGVTVFRFEGCGDTRPDPCLVSPTAA